MTGYAISAYNTAVGKQPTSHTIHYLGIRSFSSVHLQVIAKRPSDQPWLEAWEMCHRSTVPVEFSWLTLNRRTLT